MLHVVYWPTSLLRLEENLFMYEEVPSLVLLNRRSHLVTVSDGSFLQISSNVSKCIVYSEIDMQSKRQIPLRDTISEAR